MPCPSCPLCSGAPKTRHFTSYKQATDHELLTRSSRQLDAPGNSGVHFQYSEIVQAPALAGGGGEIYRKGGVNSLAGAPLTPTASRASVLARARTPEKISFVETSIEAINPLPKHRLITRPLLFSLRYRRLSLKSPFSVCARPVRARKEDVRCDRSSHCSATRPPGSAAVLRRSSRSLPPACPRPARRFPRCEQSHATSPN